MRYRFAALLVALAVTASGQSPCAVAALARATVAAPAAGDAARRAHHGDYAASAHETHPGASEEHCDGTSTTISARCPCGCTGDLPRLAASAFSTAWALPAPPLAEIGPREAPAPLRRRVRAAKPVPPPIDHVPVVA